MLFFCIGHVTPAFNPPVDYCLLSPMEIQSKKNIVIPDDALGANFDGRVISEYLQLFCLSELLSHLNSEDLIYIFQYRKFVSLETSLPVSSNLSYARHASPERSTTAFPKAPDLMEKKSTLITGEFVNVGSIALQYSKCHHPEDFCGFVVSMSRSGSFDDQFIDKFINSEVLLPAPSLGLTTIGRFRSQMTVLRGAWSFFANGFYRERHGYQRRVGGFLLERLHSFIIETEFRSSAENQCSQGVQVVVSDTPFIQANPFDAVSCGL
jgi:hypothetical protein